MEANYNWQAIHPIHGVPLAVVQATKQPLIRCDIRRSGAHPPRSWSVRISTWINTNYFLWCCCAGLADSRTDAKWTKTFNTHHRSTWNEIQLRVQEVQGESRFSIPIPEAPVESATVVHHTKSGPLEAFPVAAEPRSSHLLPPAVAVWRFGIWRVLRFVMERPAPLPLQFDVVLHFAAPVKAATEGSVAAVPGPSSGSRSSKDVIDTYYKFGK